MYKNFLKKLQIISMDSKHQKNICQIINKFQKKIQIVPNYGDIHPPNLIPSWTGPTGRLWRAEGWRPRALRA
jgi:hypothetical protein